MAVKRRLTARFVKRIVFLFILAGVFRMCWVSMIDALYSDNSPHEIGTGDDNQNNRGVPNVGKIKTQIREVTKGTPTLKPKVDICQQIVPFRRVSPTTISTFDLPDVADYSLDETRNYKLPQEVYDRSEMPLQEEIQVIVVPFSHADPGYGLSVEDYYLQYTRNVLTLMIDKLIQYPNMTFQWVETVFLERWFRDLTDTQKDQVRQLIQRGQLEIVLGGWVMPDEAITRYTSVIDQLIEGHQWLKENLGVIPENAWVNDPFGFSSTMPYLWKASGMNNLVILRIHQAIKATLMKSRNLEFMWRPYWKKDSSKDILTNVMPYTNYWASDVCGPVQDICKQFNFLHMDQDEGYVFHVTNDNIERLATALYKTYKLTAGIYEYSNLVIFLGEDNSYSQEQAWDNTYNNYMKLMEYVNNRSDWKMKIKFGTMKEYFDNVRKQESGHTSKASNHPKFPVLSGDFFPYSDREDAYWTGYYTTRPWVKKLSREVEPVLKAADAFSVLLYHSCVIQKRCNDIRNKFRQILENLRDARRELGIYQHHDGITGTSVPYVVNDYEMRLMSALDKSQQALKMTLVSLITQGQSSNPTLLQENYEKVESKNIRSDFLYTLTSGGLMVVVANPLEKTRKEIINILIDERIIDVAIGNQSIFYQLSKIDHSIVPGKLGFLLSFHVKLAPFEIQKVLIKKTKHIKQTVFKERYVRGEDTISIKTKRLKVEVESKTCHIRSITDSKGRVTLVTSRFMKYQSKASGAYLFGPAGPAAQIPGLYNEVEVYVTQGPLLSEINCFFSNGLSQRLRVYNTSGVQGQGLHVSNVIDLSNRIYPSSNTEIIQRFYTDIHNENIFFTDQNSFQLMGRKTYPERMIESNYYPISSMALIEDTKKRFTLHSAQPNGVASLENGWLEVMLDRTMDTDDGRGLGSGVFDKVKTLSEFILQIEYKSTESSLEEDRYTHQTLYNILISDIFLNPIQIFAVTNTNTGGTNTDLNRNSNILNRFANTGSDKVANMEVADVARVKSGVRSIGKDITGELLSRFIPGSPEIQLPCDTSIVNLKLLASNDLTLIGTSVILHRQPIHCVFHHDVKRCSSHIDVVNSTGLLTILGVEGHSVTGSKLVETSLSHLHVKGDKTFLADIRPDVSELRSFLVKHNVV